MFMTKLKRSVLGAMIIASVVASLLIQHQRQARLRERHGELLELEDHFARLTAESQRLAGAAVQAASPVTNDPAAELAGLRNEAQSLQKKIKDQDKPLTGNRSPRSSPAGSPEISHPPEYWEQLHQLAGSKPFDAVRLTTAIKAYASDHAGRVPASLDLVETYVRKNGGAFTGINEFDLVYQGSLDQLKNIPLGEVALIRDRQTWLAPGGKPARVYGMANGSGQIVESDDNFQAWEAEHIIVP